MNKEALDKLSGAISELLNDKNERRLEESQVDVQTVVRLVDKKIAKLKKSLVKTIVVKQATGIIKTIERAHYLTPTVAQICSAGINIMLVGPAGGGKTTCCEKVSEALGLQFFPMSVGPQTTKSDLLGFVDAGGNYHTTPLREAFERGGMLLLDEMDSAHAGVLTVLNSLLANGLCSFPDGVIKRNDNFRCICACNTYGRGADRQYVGRNQLDAATLDRFAVLDFDYDENLERAVAGNDRWVSKVQMYRKRVFDLRLGVVISPRASIYGARLLAVGIPEKRVEELVLWRGIPASTVEKIKNEQTNKE